MSDMPQIVYAGFWRRFNAYGIDATLVLAATWLLGMLCDIQPPVEQATQLDMATFDAMAQAMYGGAVDPALMQQATDGLERSLSGGSFLSLVDENLFMAISALYNILFVAGKWEATPGKHWLGIKVTGVGGRRLSLLHSAARHLATGLSMMLGGLGYLTMPFSKQKLALHDMLCHTRVIHVIKE